MPSALPFLLIGGLLTAPSPPEGFAQRLESCGGLEITEVEALFSAGNYVRAGAKLDQARARCDSLPGRNEVPAYVRHLRERAALLAKRWTAFQKNPTQAGAAWVRALLDWEGTLLEPSRREVEETFFLLLDEDPRFEQALAALFPAEIEVQWRTDHDTFLLYNCLLESLQPASTKALVQVVPRDGKARLWIAVTIKEIRDTTERRMTSTRLEAGLWLAPPGSRRPAVHGRVALTRANYDPLNSAIAGTRLLGAAIPLELAKMVLRLVYVPAEQGAELPPTPVVAAGPTPTPRIVAGPAPPATVPGGPPPPVVQATGSQVLVLNLEPLNRLNPDLAIIATAVALNAADRVEGIAALGTHDIEALLAAERRRDLFGCDEVTCFAEIGNSLGASWLVHGTMGGLGEEVLLSLTLVDTRAVTALRETRSIAGPAQLRRQVEEAVVTLLRRGKAAAATGAASTAAPRQ